jgi:hypothetical protein
MDVNPRRILKFVLRPQTTIIETADEPRFLFVDWQGEDLCVWAEAAVGTGYTSLLGVFPTGAHLPDEELLREYIGSAQTETFGQRLVFHVFRRDEV